MRVLNNKKMSNILYYIKVNNMSLHDASDKLCVSVSTLKGYCYGFRDINDVSYKKLKHFSEVLHCDIEDLVN